MVTATVGITLSPTLGRGGDGGSRTPGQFVLSENPDRDLHTRTGTT